MKKLNQLFNRARLDDRQINELLGLSHGLLADGKIDLAEAEYLQKWLAANYISNSNPIISNLLHRVNDMLSDGVFDDEEARRIILGRANRRFLMALYPPNSMPEML